MSVRWRVVLVVMLLNVAAVGVSLALGVHKARGSVRAEMVSALDGAELALRAMGAGDDPARRLAALDLRHVRVAGETARQPPRAPRWFERLIGADDATRVVRTRAGAVTIAAWPGDEIAEAWDELTGWLVVAAATLLATALAIHVAVTRALAPLSGFGRALEAMTAERPGGPLPAAGTPELEAVSARIAALDLQLAAARARNAELSRALVASSDAERAGIAREVHDELGPLLFAIGVDAHALSQASGRDQVEARARSIAGLVAEVRALSRRILGRLRPMALDHLPLSAVLADLFADVRARHPQIVLEAETAGDLDALGEAATLALYRVVQESVLNALRHGQPSRLRVAVRARPDAVHVRVEDDGPGVGAAVPAGHGVVGMRERVAALGGTVRIGSSALGGVGVDVMLPRDDARPAEAA